MRKLKILLSALVIVLMLVSVCACSDNGASNGNEVTFSLTVVHADKSEKEFEITTDKSNLRQALEDENLISGTESEYGLFVTTVDGETADYSKNESWWNLLKSGESSPTGVDGCTIADGDRFEFVYTIGY